VAPSTHPGRGLARRIARPVRHLDAEAVGIEEENRPVARLVAVLLRWKVDSRAELQTALVRLVDLLAALDEHGKVLNAHVVVAVVPAVGGSQPQVLTTETQIHALLAAAVGRITKRLGGAEGSEDGHVERGRSIEISHREINVVNLSDGHRSLPSPSAGKIDVAPVEGIDPAPERLQILRHSR